LRIVWFANIYTVSEPIGLEIVSFNNGSYTGAILFTGFMYIGAAAFMWLVRAWKIGDLEGKAAMAEKRVSDAQIDSGVMLGDVAEENVPYKKTGLVKRLFTWQKL
jgi:hypothetical protein